MFEFNKRFLVLLTIIGLAVSMSTITPGVTAADANSLIADQLTLGKITSPTKFGEFTIAAAADKAVEIDENSKVAEDGTTFAKRIKLGGAGTVEFRSIQFKLAAGATVTVYAMSSSSSADRKLGLYGLDGALLDEMVAPGTSLNKKTFTVKAGDYYLASLESGVNVYGVKIEAAGGGK